MAVSFEDRKLLNNFFADYVISGPSARSLYDRSHRDTRLVSQLEIVHCSYYHWVVIAQSLYFLSSFSTGQYGYKRISGLKTQRHCTRTN